MKKANNRITLKTYIILYALTLPSTALYCQQLFHNAHTDTKINPTSLGKKSTTNGDSQSITSTPSSWTRAYNALPLIFISSFSTGSDTGIDAFTKNLIKQLMQRQQILSKKT